MKTSVVITMIVCGTVLVALPYIHNTVIMQQIAQTMVLLNKTVNLTGDLPKHADVTCMFGGIAMIIVGAIAGFRTSEK